MNYLAMFMFLFWFVVLQIPPDLATLLPASGYNPHYPIPTILHPYIHTYVCMYTYIYLTTYLAILMYLSWFASFQIPTGLTIVLPASGYNPHYPIPTILHTYIHTRTT